MSRRAAGLAGLALVGALLGLPAERAAAAGASACGPARAGQVRVALVVDNGDLAGAPAPGVSCVSVPSGSTGWDVLEAHARATGLPGPRSESSGLLCGIGGLPAEGCTDAVGTAYRYWSYWWARPDGAWRYATAGPDTHRVHDGDVEGWRFVTGRGTSTDLAPRIAPPDAAAPCAPPAPQPTTAPTTAAPAPPSGGSATQRSGDPASAGAGAPAPAVPDPGGGPTGIDPATGAPQSPADGATGSPSAPAGASGATGATGSAISAAGAATASSDRRAGRSAKGPGGPSGSGAPRSTASQPNDGDGSGSGGAAVAAAVAVAAVVLASIQARRRRLHR